MTDRKKPGVAFWATVALVVVLVGYPLSQGPAVWLQESGYWPESLNWADHGYDPLRWIMHRSPDSVCGTWNSYVTWFGQRARMPDYNPEMDDWE
jgi:hypothetical protein